MDPIHPIRPTAVEPAAIHPLARLKRVGDDAARERERRERPPRRPAAAPATEGVTPDGHLDIRV